MFRLVCIYRDTSGSAHSLVMERNDLHHRAQSLQNFNREKLCASLVAPPPPHHHHHHITEERLATVGTLLHSRKEKAIKTESYPRRDKTPVNRDSIHAAKRPPVWRKSCPRLSALPSPLGGFGIHSPRAGSESRLPVETRIHFIWIQRSSKTRSTHQSWISWALLGGANKTRFPPPTNHYYHFCLLGLIKM